MAYYFDANLNKPPNPIFPEKFYVWFEKQELILSPYEPVLYLLKSDSENNELNGIFKSIASALKFKVFEVDNFCNNSLIATEIVAENFDK